MGKFSVEKKLQNLLKKGVRSDTGCLLWSGFISQDGYGQADGRVHRLAYQYYHKIETLNRNDYIRHNKGCPRHCFEISHLTIGTPQDNANDKVEHGKSLQGNKHPNRIITEDMALQIFQSKGSTTQRERAILFNVPLYIISSVDCGMVLLAFQKK